MSLVILLFSITAIIGLAFLLSNRLALSNAAYTPTPTKTPRSIETIAYSNLSFATSTMVIYPSPTRNIAQATRTSTPLAETDTPTMPPTATPTPTVTETFTPVPTPKPGEPTYTITPTPSITPTPTDTPLPSPTPTDTFTPAPTPQPNEPTYTPTATHTPTSSPTITPTPTATDTPTPTSTFTATPTPTDTPTVTPTPTPEMPPGWSVLNDTSYTGAMDHVFVFGEIYNNTGSTQEDILVIVAFFNDMNQQIDEKSTAPIVQAVPQGSQVPFGLEAELRLPYASYQISVEGKPSGISPRQDLQTLSHAGSAGATYRITGEIHNPGEALSTYAQVIATLYDSAGRVVNIGYDFLPAGSLGPGQTAAFEVVVEQPHQGITSYKLTLFGF